MHVATATLMEDPLMHRMRLLLLVIASLCLPAMLVAADWPQFRGPNANGIAPDTGINKDWNTRPPQVLWSTTMTDGGHGGPSVAAGKVFIIDHKAGQDIVRALDLKTGTDVWQYSYADATNDNYGFTRSTPVYHDGKLYTISRLGRVHCLDAAKGTVIWSCSLMTDFGGKKPGWDFSMSPFVDGKKVILCPGGNNAGVVALDKDTGAVIWKGGNSDTPGYATPVAATILGTKQYVVFTAYNLIGVDADTGKLLWSYPWKTGCDVNAAAPIVSGNSIFIASDYGHGCMIVAITPEGPKPAWQDVSKAMQSRFSSPVLAENVLFGNGEPNLVCLDPKTGTALWKQGGLEMGGLVVVDGTIIAQNGGNGDIFMAKLSAQGYQELGRIKPVPGSQCWTAPIVADGKLFVRNASKLVCLDLR